MNITTSIVNRPSREASLVGLAGIIVGRTNNKGLAGELTVITRPSRIYYRNDGKVTIRSYSTGTSVTIPGARFAVFGAWDKYGKPLSVGVFHA